MLSVMFYEAFFLKKIELIQFAEFLVFWLVLYFAWTELPSLCNLCWQMKVSVAAYDL